MIIGSTGERPRRIEDLVEGPLLARLERLDVRTRKMFPGKLQGERRSKRRGRSVEFEDYRHYLPGDDLRHIDWNVYARMDRLFIKIFQEEEDLAVHLVVDASASMEAGDPTKLLMAARLAMALGYIGLVKQNRVGVSVIGLPPSRDGGVGVARLEDVRGRRHVTRLGAFLLDSIWGERDLAAGGRGPREGAGFNAALRTIARARVGKGVMVILSDFLEEAGYQEGLKGLAAAGGYDTCCVQILAPGELEPEKQPGVAGDVRLTDVETGRAAEVTITAPVLRKYKERVEAYCRELERFCLAHEMQHVLVRSDASVEHIVMETLRRRGVVG
jgi:hypothetical protein